MRASIMAMVLLASQFLGERYDALSSLSLAGIIILLFSPLDLFNAGFQMSFLCVFSIITLSKPVSDLLAKTHLPKSLCDVMAISVCVNLVLLPICANVFNYVSLVGIVSNLIIIPLFSLLFPLLLIITILSSMFAFLGFSLILPEMLIHTLKLFAGIFANVSWAQFKTFNYGYLIVFFVTVCCLVTKYLMVNKIVKGSVLGVLGVVILSLFVANSIPNTFNQYTINTCFQYSNNASVITTKDNKVVLIGYDKYTTSKMLTEMRIGKLDVYVVPDFSLTYIGDYVELVKEYDVDKLVIPFESSYTSYAFNKLNDLTEIVVAENQVNVCEVALEFVSDEAKRYATKVRVNNTDVLFVNKLTKNQLLKLNDFDLDGVDYLIANELKNDVDLLNFDIDNIILSSKYAFEKDVILLANESRYVIQC